MGQREKVLERSSFPPRRSLKWDLPSLHSFTLPPSLPPSLGFGTHPGSLTGPVGEFRNARNADAISQIQYTAKWVALRKKVIKLEVLTQDVESTCLLDITSIMQFYFLKIALLASAVQVRDQHDKI